MGSLSHEAKVERLFTEAQELYSEGELDKAEAKLEEARELAESMDNGASMLQAIYNMLAGVRRVQGRNEEALELVLRALELTEQQPDPDPEQLGYLNDNIAQILRILERSAEALPYYDKAVKLMRDAEEPDVESISRSLMAQCEVYAALGQTEKSDERLRLACEIARESGTPVQICECVQSFATRLLTTDRAAEARELLQPVHDANKQTLSEPKNLYALMIGPEAAFIEMVKEEHQAKGTMPFCMLNIQVMLAWANHALGMEIDVPESLPAVSKFECEMYKHEPDELASKHQQLGVSLHFLAQATDKPSAFEAAETHYRKAIELAKKAYGKNSPVLAPMLANLRELYEDTGRDSATVKA